MSDLIARIPGVPSVTARVRQMTEITKQFKATQKLSGASGQLGYAIDSGNVWDAEIPLPYNSASFQSRSIEVLFEGDGTQDFPIALPQFDVRLNGESMANRMTFDPQQGWYVYQDAAVDVFAVRFGRIDDAYAEDPTKTVWQIWMSVLGVTGSGTMTFRVKVRGRASCPGVLTVTRTA